MFSSSSSSQHHHNQYCFQVVTLATKECADELALLHDSLRAFHSPQEVPLVVGCSTEMMKLVYETENFTQLRDDPTIHWIPCLDQYGKINRQKMEQERGVWYPTKHCDFMMEKANVMEFALHRMAEQPQVLQDENIIAKSHQQLPPGVLYVDSDITFFDSLYRMFDDDKNKNNNTQPLLGVSPHMIADLDERLFGKFNGGMLFAAHPVVLWHWKAATQTSRYFDQASIEDVYAQIVKSEGREAVQVFGPQVNYGFWRMFQTNRTSIEEEVKNFSLCKNRILYQGKPLQSVHTHWFMPTQCREIPVFNKLLKKWVNEVRVKSGSPQSVYRGLTRII